MLDILRSTINQKNLSASPLEIKASSFDEMGETFDEMRISFSIFLEVFLRVLIIILIFVALIRNICQSYIYWMHTHSSIVRTMR